MLAVEERSSSTVWRGHAGKNALSAAVAAASVVVLVGGGGGCRQYLRQQRKARNKIYLGLVTGYKKAWMRSSARVFFNVRTPAHIVPESKVQLRNQQENRERSLQFSCSSLTTKQLRRVLIFSNHGIGFLQHEARLFPSPLLDNQYSFSSRTAFTVRIIDDNSGFLG